MASTSAAAANRITIQMLDSMELPRVKFLVDNYEALKKYGNQVVHGMSKEDAEAYYLRRVVLYAAGRRILK